MDRDIQFLQTAGEAVNAAAVGLREDNDRAERRAGLNLADAREELTLRDQGVIALGLCATTRAYSQGLKALVTWAPDALTFTCEHDDEQIARWAGFNALEGEDDFEERRIKLIWMGTRQTERGTFAAQFEVVEAE